MVGVLVATFSVGAATAAVAADGPSLNVSPHSGSPGDQRTIGGSGWCPGGGLRVGIKPLDGEVTRLLDLTLGEDSDEFTGSFAVPELPVGPYRIIAAERCPLSHDLPRAE